MFIRLTQCCAIQAISWNKVLYYTNFTLSCIQVVIIVLINFKILSILKKQLFFTHNLFKWNFKIWMGLCLTSLLLHTIYIFPISGDRYGMLMVSLIREKLIFEFIGLTGDVFSIMFSLYFVCFLKFHVIHINLERHNVLFFSIFALLPNKKYVSPYNFEHQNENSNSTVYPELQESPKNKVLSN